MSLLDRVTEQIEHQINKHGQFKGHTDVIEAVNSLEPYELLTRISIALEPEEGEG